MLIYVMAAEGIFAGFINGWYYKDPHNTLVRSHTTTLLIKTHSIRLLLLANCYTHSWLLLVGFSFPWKWFYSLLSSFIQSLCAYGLESKTIKPIILRLIWAIFLLLVADILDSKAHFCWGLAFKESRHSTLCHLCRDLVLGHCCWHFSLAGHILEALNPI